ncbi:MAG TPA: biosynthetic peptidoglycan transglycosylase, partial [Candidatus Acidoferrales bacterium]|nr:biosynthetic peptidoglycan transglycosylase [Candidatus Acidoferrales bacterium]
RSLARPLAAARVRAAARARGLAATWSRLELGWPARARIENLTLRSARGDTVLSARDVRAALRVGPLLFGRAQLASIAIERARIELPRESSVAADTLAPAEDAGPGPIAPRVRQRADALVRALLAPARTLPELHLRDVAVSRGGDERVTLSALDLEHERDAERLLAAGTLAGEPVTPFDVLLRWQHDDRLTGRAELDVPDAEPPSPTSLVVVLDGRVAQDRRAREVRIAPGTQVRIGSLTASLSGAVRAKGPRFTLRVDAPRLTAADFRQSLPAAVLGPLAGLELAGSFDWHGEVDLDLARPDSVRFRAEVVPHGLALDPAQSRPSLEALAGPFTADIHLPHDRIVQRTLSDENPHYRPLDRIAPALQNAVVTNEDGGFWRHRGFNPEAISLALAADLRAGAYKRGAGTITMQLARNLWLGHRRTLSRKAQEVALAWLLEHESGLGKERLLEIYLNIIEWGPEVHGADEAAHYYFAEDASQLTLPEALFLTIVIPSPAKWRWRLAPDGTLRPFARAQMHFIASKMAVRGWLDPAQVPPADSLRITLRGPARALLALPDTSAAPADSTVEEPI